MKSNRLALTRRKKNLVPTYLCSPGFQAGDSVGDPVIFRLDRPDLLGDLDRLTLTGRLRFLISAREPCESASDEDCLRRLSLTGLTDIELVRDRRRRRGGVREMERDGLGGGEFDLSRAFGVIDREVCRGNLLLSWLRDHDLSLLLRGGGDFESKEGERRGLRGGGDLDRSDEGDRARRRGGLRERSGEGERRARRGGGGDAERLFERERRRSRLLSRRPPRPRPRPPSPRSPLGTYISRSRRGGGDLRLLPTVIICASQPISPEYIRRRSRVSSRWSAVKSSSSASSSASPIIASKSTSSSALGSVGSLGSLIAAEGVDHVVLFFVFTKALLGCGFGELQAY